MKVHSQSSALTVFLLFFACAVQSQSPEVCTKHLVISQATEETWTPGVVQNNSNPSGGKIYEIQIKIRKTGYIKFENLITENEQLPVEVVKDGVRNAPGPFKKGEIITLIARTDKNKPQPTPDNAVALKIKNKKGVSAIGYSYKQKQYIHPLTAFTIRQKKKLSQ